MAVCGSENSTNISSGHQGGNKIKYYDKTFQMYCVAYITQHLSVCDVIHFNYSSSRNHVGCTLTTMYALEEYFWTGEMFVANVRPTGEEGSVTPLSRGS